MIKEKQVSGYTKWTQKIRYCEVEYQDVDGNTYKDYRIQIKRAKWKIWIGFNKWKTVLTTNNIGVGIDYAESLVRQLY